MNENPATTTHNPLFAMATGGDDGMEVKHELDPPLFTHK